VDDLSHLFSAYFYEAWDEFEYQSWQEAVDDFARRSPERVGGATEGLQNLLAENLADDELDHRLRAAGCTYVSDQGDRAWLTMLLAHLRSEAAGSQSLSRAN
jgi:CdiI immunity protein